MSNKKSSSNTSNINNTATTTPAVPDWIANPTKNLAGQVSGLLDQGPASFTPGTSGLQQQAFDKASALTQSPYYAQAGGALDGLPVAGAGDVTGQSVLDNLDSYYSPFKSQVLDPTLADFDQNAGLTRAAQSAEAARNGAFGGSRYGVREAQTEDALARGRASTEGGLLSDMYGQATALSGADAARRQEAMQGNQSAQLSASQSNQAAALQRAQQLAALGTASGADSRANLGLQGDLGAQQTTLDNTAKQYPLTFAAQGGALLGGLDPALYTGSTVNTVGTTSSTGTQEDDPGFLGGLGKAAQIASLFVKPVALSDGRLKRDVRTVGYDAKGRRWVSFAYLWAPLKRRLGLIAQEVLRTDPDAVFAFPGGMLGVDYGALA